MKFPLPFIIIVIIVAAFGTLLAAPGRAGESVIDRDPFFSDAPRSAGTAGVRPHNSEAVGRDPFERPFAEQAPERKTESRETGRRLTGIIYSETNRLAIINGETVREGGMAGDQRVTAIRSRSVILTGRSGGSEELLLENFSIGK